MESVKNFLELWPVRLLFAFAFVAFFGAYFYLAIGRGFIEKYLGEGDWRRGATKFVAVIAVAWVTLRAVQLFAFSLWQGLPAADAYTRTSERYSVLCTVTYQTGENESETDTDWHAGDRVCAPLYQRLRYLHPRPAWIFGNLREP